MKPEAAFVSANGALLYCEGEGEGSPLVLLHGWSLDRRMFDPQMPAFTREHRIIRVDRRGFGRSSDAEDLTWNAADLRAILDHHGIARASVLGMSQGGFVALAFAAAYPDRVDRLVLHGSTPPLGFGVRWNGPDRFPIDEYRAIAREQGLDAFRRAWLAHPLTHVPAGPHEQDARRLVEAILADYRGGLLLQPVDPSGPHKGASFVDLRNVTAPALVLTGDDEIPYLRIVADALAYVLPNATRIVMPGGGHLVNLSAPERYTAAVLDFLRSGA